MGQTTSNKKYLKELFNNITKEDLKKLYCEQLLKKEDIAKILNITIHGINLLLKEYKIERDIHLVRSERNKQTKNKGFNEVKNRISNESLYKYYIEEDHSYEQTCSYFGLTGWTFDRLLKEYKIKKDRSKSFKKGLEKRIQKYGIDNVNNWKQGQETRIENAGTLEESYRLGYEKQLQTMINKYGVGCSFLFDDMQNHTKKKYSKPNEKFKTLLEKYGLAYDREFVLENKAYDFKIGNNLIEINPLITHNVNFNPFNKENNYKGLDVKYHLNKTLLAKKYGYRCIHIWPWDDAVKIIKLISPKRKMYARKCVVKEIGLNDCKTFLENNHLQGYARCNIKLGLFYDNELISVMTFSQPRYNKKYDYELIRYASSCSVIGGAEKLFKYFLNKYNPNSIISYCDNSKFTGEVYLKLGFKFKSRGIPTRHWCDFKLNHYTDALIRKNGFSRIIHGCDACKDNLPTNDNYELMRKENFLEVFDCGQSVFIWEK